MINSKPLEAEKGKTMGEQDLTIQNNDTAPTETDGGTTAADTQSVDAAKYSQLEERNALLEAELQKVRQEAAAKRVKAKEANIERQKALEENSQFKELSEHLKGSMSAMEQENAALKEQLAGTSQQAQLWQQYREAESARIAAESEGLTDEQRVILSAIPEDNLAARAQALSVFTQQPRGAIKPPPGAAPASPQATVNFDGIQDPAELRKLINQYPEQWTAYKTRGAQASANNGTFIGRVLNRGN